MLTKSDWLIPILYEDQDILVVDKPAGLATQSGHDKSSNNLFSILQKSRDETLFLHHRLDKDTSGVIILGRSTRSNKGLTDLFRDKKIEKTYLAIASNKNALNLESPYLETLNTNNTLSPIQPTFRWKIIDHLAPAKNHPSKNNPSQKKQMRMVRVRSGGWQAETHFTLIKKFNDFDLIEAKPQTGRTHQIRVHLAFEKIPILGDRLYGGTGYIAHLKIPRLMLHAKCIEFKHPVTQKPLNIEAPIPDDFAKLINY